MIRSAQLTHVLIIEDEPMIALNIQMTLEDEGVTSFDIAATEADAIAMGVRGCRIPHFRCRSAPG